MSLELTFEMDGSVSIADVRDALSGLGGDDLTEKSPVTPGCRELAVLCDDGEVVVREEGHDGEWSKTSQTAVRRAVAGVNGVGGLVETAGGYEAE